jgi:hypothetical protein
MRAIGQQHLEHRLPFQYAELREPMLDVGGLCSAVNSSRNSTPWCTRVRKCTWSVAAGQSEQAG